MLTNGVRVCMRDVKEVHTHRASFGLPVEVSSRSIRRISAVVLGVLKHTVLWA